jgi:vacuolar protein sorting-associated protein 33A
VEIGEYHLNFIPFESDILSLELDTVFRQCYVDGDTSPLNVIARALCRFQDSFGVIPHVKSKGAASKKVVQKMFHIRREEDMLNHKGIDHASRDAASQDHQVDSLVM